MNKKTILAILGSPHRTGITAAMLDYAVCQAGLCGYTVHAINLYEKNIHYCTGCRSCLTTTNCVQKDDLTEIAGLLRECSAVILAAPVYWANVPAPVKNLFDRLLGTAMEETSAFPKPRLKGKRYLILTSCNTPAPFSWIFGQSRGAIRCMDEFFKTAGMKSAGKIVCSNTSKTRSISAPLKRKIERRVRRGLCSASEA